jgi:DNA-binding MarR family transcriptional regulator
MVHGGEPANAVEAAELVAEAMIQLWRRAHLEIAPDVSDQQMRTVLALERGPLKATDLARSLGTSPSSATRLCDRLEQRGLIERLTAGRRVTIHLTEAGQKLLHVTREHRRHLLDQALSDTGADRAVLHDALGQLCALVQLAHGADGGGAAPPPR